MRPEIIDYAGKVELAPAPATYRRAEPAGAPAARAYRVRAVPPAGEFQRHDDYWVFRDLETGVFGQAPDLLGALDDFQVAAREHLDVLERQQELSEDLARQRDYLRTRIRPLS